MEEIEIPPIFLQSPPQFACCNPDLRIGQIINVHTKKPSPIWLRIPSSRFNHTLIVGSPDSGKTNAAMWISIQLFRKGWDIIVLDWKSTWRRLLYLLKPSERKRLKIYTLANPNVAPLRINLLRPPEGVSWFDWAEVVSEIFAYSYIPHPRSRSIIREELVELYFRAIETNTVPTLEMLYKRINQRAQNIDWCPSGSGEIASLNAICFCLKEFSSDAGDSKLRIFNEDVMRFEDLFVEKDENYIVVFEGGGLYRNHRAFILSLIASAIYSYYTTRTQKRRRPLLIVLEEINRMIPPESITHEQLCINISVWETMFMELRDENIYLMAIAQGYPLPMTILVNTPFKIITSWNPEKDVTQSNIGLLESISLDPQWVNIRFITRMPTGWAIVRIPWWEKHYYAFPYLVQFPLVLRGLYPSDEEIAKLDLRVGGGSAERVNRNEDK